MGEAGKAWGARKVRVVISLACAVSALFFVVAVATDANGGSDATLGGDNGLHSGSDTRTPGGGRPALNHETLPCTGSKEPPNFEIFSAGPAPAGLPLTGSGRRCDAGDPADEWPSNYFSYAYGDCEIPEGEGGCQRPLEIQTWPACQRSMADYSFEGKPLPYRKLPKHGGAEVVEFDFDIESRIEVYTKSATIVIFATDPELARKAVELLRPQEQGKPPVTDADALGGRPSEWLGPPSDGSMEGVLPCQS